MLTSGFSAEYGRYGGGVFIAITRAGTNEFHGSVWEYLRNKAFDARNFFSAEKPDLKQNQFGFTFGGPVIHKRTFFFGSYEGTRIRQSQVLSSATPPTAAERAGDFSALEQEAGRSDHQGAIPRRQDSRHRVSIKPPSASWKSTFHSRTPRTAHS